jgi:hypothetical protein
MQSESKTHRSDTKRSYNIQAFALLKEFLDLGDKLLDLLEDGVESEKMESMGAKIKTVNGVAKSTVILQNVVDEVTSAPKIEW